jgi:glycosyltransferase involved in cell wall biosynthesis
MSLARRRLLFVAPVMPDCGGNGLAMRQGQFLAAYAKDFDVDLAVIPLAGSADADDQFARRRVRRMRVFNLAAADTHFSLLMRLHDPAARASAFAAYGRPSIAARLTADVKRTVNEWVAGQAYELVHVGRLYLLAADTCAAPLLVDADEDDSKVFRQIAGAWAQAEAANAALQAAKHLPGVRHVFAASPADAASLAHFNPAVTVIPNTVALPRRFRTAHRRPRILFTGTLGYGPNEEALVWFIAKCWQRLHRLLPYLQFDVIGGGASTGLRRLMARPGIVWHGWQKDLAPFYGRADAVVVPVRAGGGSRLKMLEAAAYGRAIVATAVGADGSELAAGRDFLRADEPAGFVRAVVRALRRQSVLGRAARRAVARGHDPARWRTQIRSIARAIATDQSV